MSSILRWEDGVHADRSELQQFCCTTDKAKRASGRWNAQPPVVTPELEAQGFIRNLQPPAGRGQMILVGRDDDGIAAVCFSETNDGPWDVFIKVLGVALRHRGGGSLVALETLELLIDRHMSILLASDNDDDDLVVSGNVHPSNTACAKLCERQGGVFEPEGDGKYDEWVLRVPRPF